MIMSKEKFEKKKSDKGDILICYSVFSNFVILSIQYFILNSFSLLNSPYGTTLQIALKGVVFLFFLRALPIVLKRKGKTFIFTYFVIGFIYLLNVVFFPQNIIYLNEYILTLITILVPIFVYVYSVIDLSIFEEVMKKACYFVIATSGTTGILMIVGIVSVGMYSMTLSYYLLFPAVVFLNEYIKHRKKGDLFFFLISSILILVLGARGPLLSISSFLILLFIFYRRKKNHLYYIYNSLIILAVFLISIFFNEIVEYLYTALLYFGIDSRTLYLMTLGKIHLSGRELIYLDLIKYIRLSPIIGYGLAGDVYLLGGDGFAHNFILEILINFGFIFGGGIFLSLIILIYKGLKSSDYLNVELIIIFFSLGLTHLLVSSSYLIDFKFWIFIGLILNIYNKQRRREVIE